MYHETIPANAGYDIQRLKVIAVMPKAIIVKRDTIVTRAKKTSKTVRKRITLCLGNGVSSAKLLRLDAQCILSAGSGDKSRPG